MRQDPTPTISRNSRDYETNDVAALESHRLSPIVLLLVFFYCKASISKYLWILRYNTEIIRASSVALANPSNKLHEYYPSISHRASVVR